MLAKKIALNTIISSIVRVLGTIIALFIIGMMTRYFSKSDWGEYSIIMTFGSVFSVLAELGLYQIMTREICRGPVDEKKIASNIFTLRLLVSFFIFALAPLVSLLFPYSEQARWGILIGMLGFWFLSDGQVLMGIFQKYLRMDKVALAEIAGRLVQLGLVFWLIKKGAGFLPLVSVFTLSSLVNLGLIFVLARGHIKLTFKFDFSFWRAIIKESWHLALSNVLVMVYFSAGSLLLSVFRPPADVGIFRLAYKVLESLIFFPAMFVGLVMPFLSRAAIGNRAEFKAVLQRSQDVLLIFGVPLVLGLAVLAQPTIALLGGRNYPEAGPLLAMLMVSVGAIFLGTLLSYALIALGKQKNLLVISVVAVSFNLLFNLIFIPRYSYLAVTWSSLLTESLVTISLWVVLARLIKFWPSFKVGLKSFLAAGLMALFLWYFRQANLFGLIAAGMAIYFVVLYLIKGFSWQQILELTKGNEADVVQSPPTQA